MAGLVYLQMDLTEYGYQAASSPLLLSPLTPSLN